MVETFCFPQYTPPPPSWNKSVLRQSYYVAISRVFTVSSLLQLEQSVETANDRAEVANHDLKADIERWHKNKRQDFRKLFMDYSECLIEYFKQVIMHATSLFLSTKNACAKTYATNSSVRDTTIPEKYSTFQAKLDLLQRYIVSCFIANSSTRVKPHNL